MGLKGLQYAVDLQSKRACSLLSLPAVSVN